MTFINFASHQYRTISNQFKFPDGYDDDDDDDKDDDDDNFNNRNPRVP